MPSYDIDQSVRLWAVFEVDGVLTDPTTITVKVQDPSGNEATYTYAGGTVTRHSTGLYYKDVLIDESGTWYYKYIGTGSVSAAEERSFSVDTSQF